MFDNSTYEDSLLVRYPGYWYYEMRLNVIISDTRSKRPLLKSYKDYQLRSISESMFLIWIQEGLFEKEITRTSLTGQHSCTLMVPRSFTRQYGLDELSHVIVEGTEERIVTRKLEV